MNRSISQRINIVSEVVALIERCKYVSELLFYVSYDTGAEASFFTMDYEKSFYCLHNQQWNNPFVFNRLANQIADAIFDRFI